MSYKVPRTTEDVDILPVTVQSLSDSTDVRTLAGKGSQEVQTVCARRYRYYISRELCRAINRNVSGHIQKLTYSST